MCTCRVTVSHTELELHVCKFNLMFHTNTLVYALKILTFRLVLRVAADDPLGAHPFGHKFGCSIEDGKKLLQLCKQLELHVIGVWYVHSLSYK